MITLYFQYLILYYILGYYGRFKWNRLRFGITTALVLLMFSFIYVTCKINGGEILSLTTRNAFFH